MSFRVTGDNQVHYIPGAYGRARVVTDRGLPNDPFQVGVMIGRQMHGVPYNANGADGKGSETLYQLAQSSADIHALTGYDSVLSEAFEAAKVAPGNPLPRAYFIGISPTTKSSATIPDDAAGDSIDLISKDWGAATGDIQITIVAGGAVNSIKITLTPPKDVAYLSADSGTDKVIEVNRIMPFMRAGATVYLTDNSTAAVSKVIESVDAANKRITFTSAISSGVTKANNARIYLEDSDNAETSGDLLTLDDVESFFAKSTLVAGTRSDGATDIPDTIAKTAFKELTGATAGTSPEPQASDWTALMDMMDTIINEFAIETGFQMRVFYPVTPTHSIHVAWATYAATRRQAGMPISVVVGGDLSEVDFTADSAPTDPIDKLRAINSEDVQVCFGGLDSVAPYKSFAAQLFGIRCSNSVLHNQTRDQVKVATPEAYWQEGESNAELLINAGATFLTVPTLNPRAGFVIAKGQNSLQSQNAGSTWNADGTTWLIRQRDLADISQRLTLQVLDAMTGSDGANGQGVTEAQARSAVVNVIDQLGPEGRGYVTDGQIQSIVKDGEGWQVAVNYTLPGETNYFGVVFNLYPTA